MKFTFFLIVNIFSIFKNTLFPVGHCHGFLERYYFSFGDNRCLPFMYTGCGGNENNFASRTECMDVCTKNSRPSYNHGYTKGVEYVTIIPRVRSDCNKPIKRGICAASIKMYGYDMLSGKCREFTYTGCAGNSNRFFSLSSCKSVCEQQQVLPRPVVRRPWERYLFTSFYQHLLMKNYIFNRLKR